MLFDNGFFIWVFFAQSPVSFAKVKDSANSLLKAADYSSSSDEVSSSSSSSSDEDDTHHTRLAWLFLLLLIIVIIFSLHTSKYLEKAGMHKYSPSFEVTITHLCQL